MRPPRVRFTVRGAMALVVLVSILLGWTVHSKRIKHRLINQDIRVAGAEAAYRNGELAREAAETAVARYIREKVGDGENLSPPALKAAATQAQKRELALEAEWKLQKDILLHLVKEFYD